MDINTLLPVISNVLGRDLSVEVNLFYRGRAAIGRSLDNEGQMFFINNWPKLIDFMETIEGQKAITAFIDAWATKQNAPITPPPIG